MEIKPELIDELLKDYQKPEDIIGENGLLKRFVKAVLERALRFCQGFCVNVFPRLCFNGSLPPLAAGADCHIGQCALISNPPTRARI